MNGTFLIFCIAMGLIAMSLAFEQRLVAAAVLALLVGGVLTLALRQGNE